ncbi:50S ribosomal protein L13 [Candidatus Peregrinibacteria bacterium]|nr:50S ribosomal protein L13 [Candidatus Peregrinibacteria bacterium]
MKTYLPKKKDLVKAWYLINAEGKVLGDVSTVIANKLRGKDKPIFTPHMDCGDFMIVINADKIRLTGEKLDKKIYHRHTGYPGKIIETSARKIMEKKPAKLIEMAVKGMLPKNKLRKGFLKKLKIYAGSEHPHTAQSPISIEI